MNSNMQFNLTCMLLVDSFATERELWDTTPMGSRWPLPVPSPYRIRCVAGQKRHKASRRNLNSHAKNGETHKAQKGYRWIVFQKIKKRIICTHASPGCTDSWKNISLSFQHEWEGAFIEANQGIFNGRASTLGAHDERGRVYHKLSSQEIFGIGRCLFNYLAEIKL